MTRAKFYVCCAAYLCLSMYTRLTAQTVHRKTCYARRHNEFYPIVIEQDFFCLKYDIIHFSCLFLYLFILQSTNK